MLSLESEEGSLWPVVKLLFLLGSGEEEGVTALVEEFVFLVGAGMAIGEFICGNIGGGLLLLAFIWVLCL
jgi:hypothetical protein